MSEIEKPNTRSDLPRWLADNGWVVGAEVGVWEGQFSARILAEPRIKTLYSVDNWMCHPAPEFYQPAYDKAVKALAPYGGRSRIIIKASVPAAYDFVAGNEFLDFVYIDADHSYEACLSDMEAWWKVVRRGGCLCGHDLKMKGVAKCKPLFVVPMGAGLGSTPKSKEEKHGVCGVEAAVNEFVEDKKLDLLTTKERCPSWMLIKP